MLPGHAALPPMQHAHVQSAPHSQLGHLLVIVLLIEVVDFSARHSGRYASSVGLKVSCAAQGSFQSMWRCVSALCSLERPILQRCTRVMRRSCFHYILLPKTRERRLLGDSNCVFSGRGNSLWRLRAFGLHPLINILTDTFRVRSVGGVIVPLSTFAACATFWVEAWLA